MDKIFIVALFLLYLGNVLCQDCNKLNECMLQFSNSFGELQTKMGDPEGIKTFCSDMDNTLEEVKECQKTATGDDDQACAQMISMQNHQIETMSGMFDKMICKPGDECSLLNVFKCYGDFFKGFGIDSIETLDDLSEIMKLENFDVKDIDQEKFCKYTVSADQEGIGKCVQEKSKVQRECMNSMGPGGAGGAGGPGGPGGPGGAGGPGGPGGPGDGGPPPEGAEFPEGFDPSSMGMPAGGPMPGGPPEGSDAENSGPLGAFSFDMTPFQNASVICQPGCGNFFKTQDTLASFMIEDSMISAVNNAENGTDEYLEACGALDGKLQEAEDAAGGCTVQQGIVTGKVEANAEIETAMGKCELSLEFSSEGSGAVSIALSFYTLAAFLRFL